MNKIRELLEAYHSDLNWIWNNTDSGDLMDYCRHKQAEIQEVLGQTGIDSDPSSKLPVVGQTRKDA